MPAGGVGPLAPDRAARLSSRRAQRLQARAWHGALQDELHRELPELVVARACPVDSSAMSSLHCATLSEAEAGALRGAGQRCAVCVEDFAAGDEQRQLPCGHGFHRGCVDPWLLEQNGTCPMCRGRVLGDGQAVREAASGEAPRQLRGAGR